MEFLRRLWRKCKKKMIEVIYRKPKDGDYYYLEPLEDTLDLRTTSQITESTYRELEGNRALEKVIEMALINTCDVCVQTDVSQMNGYVVYKYDLEQYLVNERKQIEQSVVLMYENNAIENVFRENN